MENSLDRRRNAALSRPTAARDQGSLAVAVALVFALSPGLAQAEVATATQPQEQAVLDDAPTPGAADINLVQSPGRRIQVGRAKLHLFCSGQGSPTVILEAGLGGFSLEWSRVQTGLAPSFRVCSYDRAGYGWSEPIRGRRTAREIVTELHDLLEKAGESPPYVLVGHSFGGYSIQSFAQRFPDLVSGLVMVDASHPAQHDRLPHRSTDSQRQSTRGRRLQTSTPTLPDDFPTEYAEIAYHLMYAPKAVAAQRKELADFDASGRQVLAGGALPEVPLIVLTRGQRVWPMDSFGDEMERAWTALQDDLAASTHPSAHWIAHASGHYIHLDEPRLVIDAVLAVARSASGDEPLPVLPPWGSVEP